MWELKYKINEHIIELLKKNSEGDSKVQEVLLTLLFEEAVHDKIWQWKEKYKEEIEKCVED